MDYKHAVVESLKSIGIDHYGKINIDLNLAELMERSIQREEGQLSSGGALCVETGKHTGRSPNDRYFVKNQETETKVFWSDVNLPISEDVFDRLFSKILAYLQQKEIFVKDFKAGADIEHSVNLRVISELAWPVILSSSLFINLSDAEKKNFSPEFTILHCPHLKAVPELDDIRSETFIMIDLTKKLVIIGNSGYGGEIKKSMFTILNYLNPQKGTMSMHCSANVGEKEDVALFFGLSGTGKTTLSADPARKLIGDDEHGWTDNGVFNYEGGCYAKMINLKQELEPVIYKAAANFGVVLENVVLDDETRIPDYDNNSLTENTRAAYPLAYVENHLESGCAGHPKNIFFLTADAFGVMPPIARLTIEQAMYYFLAGYTSKLAGTEVGLGKEPVATFSMCFGAPFMPLNPNIYAELLEQKISKHDVSVWLINTGWTGGPYGVGSRMKLPYTRAMIHAVLDGDLSKVVFNREQYFGLYIPESCPNVPAEILRPVNTWKDKSEYEKQANVLISLFEKNFSNYKSLVKKSVFEAGPSLSRTK